MFTVSDIIADIDRGCKANNMQEDKFSYRIVFFVNESGRGTKHYMDTMYGGLRESLENIIRRNLSVTNHIVIAAVTVRKDGQSVCLHSKSYTLSLDDYFRQISGSRKRGRNDIYGGYAVGQA